MTSIALSFAVITASVGECGGRTWATCWYLSFLGFLIEKISSDYKKKIMSSEEKLACRFLSPQRSKALKPAVAARFYRADHRRQLSSWYKRKSLLLESDTCGYLSGKHWGGPEVHRRRRRRRQQAPSVCEDEAPEPVRAGLNWWCRSTHCLAIETEMESLCCSECQHCQSHLKEVVLCPVWTEECWRCISA